MFNNASPFLGVRKGWVLMVLFWCTYVETHEKRPETTTTTTSNFIGCTSVKKDGLSSAGRANSFVLKQQFFLGSVLASFLFGWMKFLPRRRRDNSSGETHAAMERLAADSGLTSATSLAFCRAIFWLAASSSSCSSCRAGRKRAGQAKEWEKARDAQGWVDWGRGRTGAIQKRWFSKSPKKRKEKKGRGIFC